MQTSYTELDDLKLASAALGDIVVLPDGQPYTIRSRVALDVPIGSMAGFVLLGELQVLLSTPPSIVSPIGVYVPVPKLPPYASGARAVTAYQGATRYWAPHLPPVGGAMGELLYRVLAIRTQPDPVVLVYRGDEAIIFVKASFVWGHDLQIERMGREVDNEYTVDRFAGVVVGQPAVFPDRAPSPAPAYARPF